ncbi:MAG: ABC transporter permease [Paludibacteraceae bacterium]|nr:ABC transporter permease [Paludibacteraceae bacterium]
MDFLQEIWATISRNRSRSLLTAFGVFWGILMLMVLMGLGNAMTNGIYSQVEGFAMNSCFVAAGSTSKPYKGFQQGRSWNIKTDDLEFIEREVKGVACLVPVVQMGSVTVSYGDKHDTYTVMGTSPDYPRVQRTDLVFGRFVNAIDMQQKRKVCVLGNKVYHTLFPRGENPVGLRIRCGAIEFTVIGVRAKKTGSVNIGGDADEMVYAPLSTVQQIVNIGEKVHYMMALAEENVPVTEIDSEIRRVLKERHSIAPDDEKAIFGFNAEEELKALGYLKMGLQALVWLIGLGTLISGAVGVSNIMLVTVRERTKEIGVRRALGASPWLIARQIMAESTVLTALAGIVGIMVGVGILAVMDVIMSQNEDAFLKDPQVHFGAAIACLVIIIIVGLLAGLLPALRALKIKPIEALSEE